MRLHHSQPPSPLEYRWKTVIYWSLRLQRLLLLSIGFVQHYFLLLSRLDSLCSCSKCFYVILIFLLLLCIHRDHKDYLGRGAKDGHLDFHTAPELWILNKWLSLFIEHLNSHQSGVLTVLFGCYMAGATWNCCCLSVFYTPYNHAPVYSVTSCKATYTGCMHI